MVGQLCECLSDGRLGKADKDEGVKVANVAIALRGSELCQFLRLQEVDGDPARMGT